MIHRCISPLCIQIVMKENKTEHFVDQWKKFIMDCRLHATTIIWLWSCDCCFFHHYSNKNRKKILNIQSNEQKKIFNLGAVHKWRLLYRGGGGKEVQEFLAIQTKYNFFVWMKAGKGKIRKKPDVIYGQPHICLTILAGFNKLHSYRNLRM